MSHVIDLLIVDDDPSQLHLTQILMRDLGLSHRCHYVSNGQDALDFLCRNSPFESAPRPDLILLDLNMPGMHGCQVLQIVKSDVRFNTIPVIVLSNSENATDITACYSQHANAYIRKPLDLESNLQILKNINEFWTRTARLPKPQADKHPKPTHPHVP